MFRILIPVIVVSGLFLLLSFRLYRTAFESAGAEGWLASFFLLVGLSMPLRVIFVQLMEPAVGEGGMGVLSSHALMTLALSCFTVFIARVFRPEVQWARALMLAIILLQVAAPLLLIFFGSHRDEQHGSVLVVSAIRGIPFLWGFCEALSYYARMRRRLGLGLADPVVANRFLLFAGWNGSLFAMLMVTIIARLGAVWFSESRSLTGVDSVAQSLMIFLVGSFLLLGTTTAASLWLGFFPPEAWERRLRAAANGSPREPIS